MYRTLQLQSVQIRPSKSRSSSLYVRCRCRPILDLTNSQLHQNTNPTVKEGWAWVEETCDKDDRTRIEGYNEDMDALLVFVSII